MPETKAEEAKVIKHLVLHVLVPVNAEDLDEAAANWADGVHEVGPHDRLDVVLEEWMRPEVGITIVTLPGEKCLNDEFEVHAYQGLIVGADSLDVPEPKPA